LLRHRFINLGACAALGCAAALTGARAATQVLSYNVEHPTYGTIGTYTNTVQQSGKAVSVHTDLHVTVKIMGIPLYHEDATREEQWQGQRLIAFRGTTDDNGKKITVTGKADGTRFVIRSSSDGTVIAPPQVHPSNPWAPFLLQTDTIMSTKTGHVSRVAVKDTGEVSATLDGRPMRVHQWFVDGEKHEVVWLDARGMVVGFQTQEEGTPIKFVLKSEAHLQSRRGRDVFAMTRNRGRRERHPIFLSAILSASGFRSAPSASCS